MVVRSQQLHSSPQHDVPVVLLPAVQLSCAALHAGRSCCCLVSGDSTGLSSIQAGTTVHCQLLLRTMQGPLKHQLLVDSSAGAVRPRMPVQPAADFTQPAASMQGVENREV